jgi:macrolide-specific efflux system membrane fusion protein
MTKSQSKIILLILLIAAGVALAFYFTKSDEDGISYREEKVKRGAIQIAILATGTVQPENRIEIKPPIPGRIEKVLIEEGQMVHKGQILAWMSSTERATLLDSARAKGPQELKKWEEIYPATPIIAPLKGTIVLKNVEEGETFTGTDSLMSMSDRLTVKAQVDETDIASIKLKQKAEIILDAYPDNKIPARVDKIAFDATTVNSVTTYIIDVLPLSVPDFMRSGMTANVTFFSDLKSNILIIPSEAVKTQNGKFMVTTRDDDGKTIEKEVTTGISDGKEIEITSGLDEGEIVLLTKLELKKKQNLSPFNPMNRGRK